MRKIIYTILAVILTATFTKAQTLDYTFNAGTVDCPSYLGNPSVSPITLQPDGKILVSGNFTTIGGDTSEFLTRLNQDGTPDHGFDQGNGPQSRCNAIVLQPDGKILIGGLFTSYNGTARNYIARIHSNGSIDTTFNPGLGANSHIRDIALQPDGKILIGGFFTSYNGKSQNYLARLHPNGLLDTTFNIGEDAGGADGAVISISLQTDGKIIIGGSFSTYNGTSRKGIARLNPDGYLDNNFNPGLSESYIYKVLIQSDGKILAGGDQISFNDTVYHCMRFNTDGSVDATFIRWKGAAAVRSIAIQQDGKIFIGGVFSTYNGTPRNCIARLNQDGSVDTTFDTGQGPKGPPNDPNNIEAITLQSDGRILVGGYFTSYNGIKIDNIARLTSNFSNVSDMHHVEQPLATLFPVPTRENFFITTEERIAERIDVMNLLGQVVVRVEPSSLQTEISLTDQPNGMFVVMVQMRSTRQIFKLLKGK